MRIEAIDARNRAHTECHTLLQVRGGRRGPHARHRRGGLDRSLPGRVDAGEHLLRSIDDGSVIVVNLDESDLERSRELLHAYRDLQLEYLDAAVITVAERLGETTVATLDRRHFSAVQPLHCEAFTLLP